ncbi:MAG: NADH:flavin oxidoreductase/NADH oxidase family protein [Proteobacteria bacterium]|nr:NADH:flavin oxidoreductase/NADH oxidase family protein [Pseudomonadota bacterium]
MPIDLATPIDLPCGITLPNRLCKAAMTEGLADAQLRATARLARVYQRWAEGGIGLSLTGNVQVDRHHLERPGNVAIGANGGLDALRAYADAGKMNGTELWMQINHPGRQEPASISPNPRAPSDVQMGSNDKAFGKPIPLSGDEIETIIDSFTHVAETAKMTGFTGIQMHSAHGYLSSEFLSPVVNRRADQWGGPLENRARFLLNIVRNIREACGKDFAISVKLNSTDFQQGAFTLDECQQVVAWLGAAGVDLLEVSGGTYEQPAMVGQKGNAKTWQDPLKHSTQVREAYFVDYAKAIAPAATMPLMVTGGFRTRDAMMAALNDGGVDVIGLARPLCGDPDSPAKLLRGEIDVLPAYEKDLLITEKDAPDLTPFQRAMLQQHGQQGWFCMKIIEMGDGFEPDLDMTCMEAVQAYDENEFNTNEARKAALGVAAE